MKFPDVETQAIMALCSDARFNAECPACAFRRDAAVEHVQVSIANFLESLNETKP